MKGIIVYKGKYGATLQYADWLGDALHLPVFPAGDESAAAFHAADYVIMGSSIYIGKLRLHEWLLKNEVLLLDKKLIFFMVCGTPLKERDKLEGFIKNNVPLLIRQRCSFYFLPGRLVFNNLTRADRLLLRIGAWMGKKTGAPAVITDYDNVKMEHLQPIINEVKDNMNPVRPIMEPLPKQFIK